MGAKNNTDIKEEKIEESKMLNPFFQQSYKISNEECMSFEIYQLKNINNAFYIASISEDKRIIIYKYLYSIEEFKEIIRIKTIIPYCSQIKLKYYCDPRNGEEYLFIVKDYKDLEIYLIKSEKNYILISKKKTQTEMHSAQCLIEKIDIIYNTYEDRIYVIVVVDHINIQLKGIILYEFNDKFDEYLQEIKLFKLNESETANILYEDKKLKKHYLIIIGKNVRLIEITNNSLNELGNLIEIEDELKNLNIILNMKINNKACFVNTYNNDEYLYIFYKAKILLKGEFKQNKIIVVTIDMLKRKTKDIISLNNEFTIHSIANWKNNYIILASKHSIYIFDLRINKIISNYTNFFNDIESIELVRPFFVENKFYGLFILFSRLTYLVNLEKKKLMKLIK